MPARESAPRRLVKRRPCHEITGGEGDRLPNLVLTALSVGSSPISPGRYAAPSDASVCRLGRAVKKRPGLVTLKRQGQVVSVVRPRQEGKRLRCHRRSPSPVVLITPSPDVRETSPTAAAASAEKSPPDGGQELRATGVAGAAPAEAFRGAPSLENLPQGNASFAPQRGRRPLPGSEPHVLKAPPARRVKSPQPARQESPQGIPSGETPTAATTEFDDDLIKTLAHQYQLDWTRVAQEYGRVTGRVSVTQEELATRYTNYLEASFESAVKRKESSAKGLPPTASASAFNKRDPTRGFKMDLTLREQMLSGAGRGASCVFGTAAAPSQRRPPRLSFLESEAFVPGRSVDARHPEEGDELRDLLRSWQEDENSGVGGGATDLASARFLQKHRNRAAKDAEFAPWWRDSLESSTALNNAPALNKRKPEEAALNKALLQAAITFKRPPGVRGRVSLTRELNECENSQDRRAVEAELVAAVDEGDDIEDFCGAG